MKHCTSKVGRQSLTDEIEKKYCLIELFHKDINNEKESGETSLVAGILKLLLFIFVTLYSVQGYDTDRMNFK